MKDIVAWMVPIQGLTLVVTCSTIFKPIREWFGKHNMPKLEEMLCCPMCFGWWTGLAASTFGFSLSNLGAWIVPGPARVFIDAFAASYVCWVSHVVLCKLGQGRLLSSRPDLKGSNT